MGFSEKIISGYSILNQILDMSKECSKSYHGVYESFQNLLISEFPERQDALAQSPLTTIWVDVASKQEFLISSIITTTENLNNYFSMSHENVVLNDSQELKYIFNKFSDINNRIIKVFPDAASFFETNFYKSKPRVQFSTASQGVDELIFSFLDIIKELDQLIVSSINKIESLNSETIVSINRLKDRENLKFQNRFDEETGLIIKKYEHELRNLTESFKNQIENLKIDQEAVVKSNELLKKNSDVGLKKLAELNEKTQNLDLELSKIIGVESDKIKSDLAKARGKIAEDLNNIITDSKDQTDAIKLAHSDFIGLVEKAGIYKLTENYDKKATEEKKEYKLYSWATIISIGLAILTTIIVITIPIVEHWKANPPIDTNYFTIMARLSISFMFFVLAVYTARQSAKHYECYQENHRTFLQLAALEPFMARMTPEEQKEIRKGLIPSYFNQANDGKYASKGDDIDLPTNITSIINNLVDKGFANKEAVNSVKTENNSG